MFAALASWLFIFVICIIVQTMLSLSATVHLGRAILRYSLVVVVISIVTITVLAFVAVVVITADFVASAAIIAIQAIPP
jgi:hypothetical protein